MTDKLDMQSPDFINEDIEKPSEQFIASSDKISNIKYILQHVVHESYQPLNGVKFNLGILDYLGNKDNSCKEFSIQNLYPEFGKLNSIFDFLTPHLKGLCNNYNLEGEFSHIYWKNIFDINNRILIILGEIDKLFIGDNEIRVLDTVAIIKSKFSYIEILFNIMQLGITKDETSKRVPLKVFFNKYSFSIGPDLNALNSLILTDKYLFEGILDVIFTYHNFYKFQSDNLAIIHEINNNGTFNINLSGTYKDKIDQSILEVFYDIVHHKIRYISHELIFGFNINSTEYSFSTKFNFIFK